MPSTWSKLLLHIVFSTKNREPFISADIQPRLHAFLGGIVRDEDGNALAIGGMSDHVHLLVTWKTDGAIADLMRNVKARSSAWMHNEMMRTRFAWQAGYGVFSVSASNIEQVRAYIHNQEDHHRVRGFREELVASLTAHGVEFDDRYVD